MPALGDIVWCHWPEKGRNAIPGPKPRPCLVLALDEAEAGHPVVLVAYGTSRKLDRLHAGEFSITQNENPAAYEAAGLSYDTKFDLRQTAWLPYSSQAFGVAPGAPYGQVPKLGLLHPSLMRAAARAHAAAAR